MDDRPFSQLAVVSAPDTLKTKTLDRIAGFERRACRVRIAGWVALAAASIGAFAASCAYAWNAASSSGFIQYISLAFSGSTAVFSYSKDLSLSIVESLPALGIALILAAGLVSAGAVWSSVRALKQRSRVVSFA
ncbi:MAG: hypothetical protein KGI79_00230 [Patescibacteria group bacterium]|nr:hypothetical protein [Patescibacteria group bacterium]MDE2116298.1 hypothetical protein [Patescibacteria group bacterium]